MKRINISDLKIRILSDCFGYLSKAPEAGISESQLGATYIAVDPEDKSEQKVRLITISRLTGLVIPEIFAYHSENEAPELCRIKVLQRAKVQNVDQLCYYLYQKVNE